MKTRKQYLNGDITHREYYAQFITPEMVTDVRQGIGEELILASTDEHMNDIRLSLWDRLSGCSFRGNEMITKPTIRKNFKELVAEADDSVSAATLVCVYKEIAQQFKETKQWITQK
jgi:hypothetical protein